MIRSLSIINTQQSDINIGTLLLLSLLLLRVNVPFHPRES